MDNSLIKKLNRRRAALPLLHPNIKRKTIFKTWVYNLIYFSIIRPIIKYGLPVWGNTRHTHLRKF